MKVIVQLLFIYRYWFAPVGRSLGIKSSRPKPPPLNSVLDTAYNQSTRLSHKTVSKFLVCFNTFAFTHRSEELKTVCR